MNITKLLVVMPFIYTYSVQGIQTTVVKECKKLANTTRRIVCELRKKGCEYTKTYAYEAAKKTGCGLKHAKRKMTALYKKAYNKMRGKDVEHAVVEEIPDVEAATGEVPFDINQFMKLLEELQRQSKEDMGNEGPSGDGETRSNEEEEPTEEEELAVKEVEVEEERQEL